MSKPTPMNEQDEGSGFKTTNGHFTIPDRATKEDIVYFENKVKRRSWDAKAQAQLAAIRKHFGVES